MGFKMPSSQFLRCILFSQDHPNLGARGMSTRRYSFVRRVDYQKATVHCGI
jgi:hypothetical protein